MKGFDFLETEVGTGGGGILNVNAAEGFVVVLLEVSKKAGLAGDLAGDLSAIRWGDGFAIGR